MRPEDIRTMEELINLPEFKNSKFEIFSEGNILLIVPKNEVNKWMWKIFVNAIPRKFIWLKGKINYYKRIVNFMRRLYNQFPIVFGYSIRHPLDEIDDEFGYRIAMERLLVKLKKQEQYNNMMKIFEW